MLVDENGKQTITNDGATVMKVLHTPYLDNIHTLTKARV